jgi:hypothetical protein
MFRLRRSRTITTENPTALAASKGIVSADGTATVTLDLASVQTNIEIRDERNARICVQEYPKCNHHGHIGHGCARRVAVGAGMTMETSGTLHCWVF